METGESLSPFLSESVWVFLAWQEMIALAEILFGAPPCSVLLEILGDVSSQFLQNQPL